MQNLKRKIRKINQNKFNKRHLRADVLSLLSSALRPRLLSAQEIANNHIKLGNFYHYFVRNSGKYFSTLPKIVALSTIPIILGGCQTLQATPVSAASLTLTIPSSPLSLDLNPTVSNGFATTSSSFNVKTDNSSGYTVSIKSKNENGDNSLVNGNNKLTSITEATTEDGFKNDPKFINMWGWLPNKLNSEDNNNYQIAPGIEEVVLDNTKEANETGTDYNISLAAKASNSIPTGVYENTFVISAVANKKPLPETMQEFTNDHCALLETDETVTLKDKRDNNEYTIAKLKDSRCWMTQNLRIVGKNLTSDDSDINGSFTIPDSSLSKFNVGSNGYNTNIGKNNDAAYYDENNINYGASYTWHTATAGTGIASQTTQGWNTSNSICPKGWKLPTGGTGGDYETLIKAYDISSSIAGATILASPPLNFTFGGAVNYVNGIFDGRGSYGDYWTSTVNNATTAYILGFSSENVNPLNSDTRPYGVSVRCVQRNYKSMQKVNQWSSDVKTGEIVDVIDERDGSTYTVARLNDGKLWMTQNLRIIGQDLTVDDSDISSPFSIPDSNLSKFNIGTNGYNNETGRNNDAAYYGDDTSYGAHYTWHTATAGTGTASQTAQGWNAPSSICPKGWKLPTGGSNGDYEKLVNTYNISNNATGSTTLRNNPFNFILNGHVSYTNGTLQYQNERGYYWSSTVYDVNIAYLLGLRSDNVTPTNYSNRPNGFAVRCVARD